MVRLDAFAEFVRVGRGGKVGGGARAHRGRWWLVGGRHDDRYSRRNLRDWHCVWVG